MKPIDGEDVGLPEVRPEDLDHRPVQFGKYKKRGLTPSQIAERDPGYIVYMYEYNNTSGSYKPCSKALYEDCKAEIRNGQDYDEEEEELLRSTFMDDKDY